jgi:undecaprenol kinase
VQILTPEAMVNKTIKPSMKNQSSYKRLGFAFQGVAAAWRNEQSFRQQCAISFGVLLILIWRNPEPFWWALLLVNCGMVLAAELFNTALEHALDHLSPAQHSAVQIAKDCSAGAVLMLSLTAVCVFIAFLIATWLT